MSMGPFESIVEDRFSATGLVETPWGWGTVTECLREAATATPAIATGRMSGELKLSSSGWALLDVPNSFVRGVFDSMDEPGISLPISSEFGSGKLNAHVSVMDKDEVDDAGGPTVVRASDGRAFRYQLGPMKVVKPKRGSWKRVWYITVNSPELEAFRKEHGLSARPNKNKFDFHVTVAVIK